LPFDTAQLLERANMLHQLLRTAKGGDRGQRTMGSRGASLYGIDDETDRSRELRGVPSTHVSRRVHALDRATVQSGRFPKSRTHKASSAEAILAHVLKQRGWTRRWDAGRLTDRQRLRLLEDIRLYGRQWLRHEAESFFERYGDVRDEQIPRRIRARLDRERGGSEGARLGMEVLNDCSGDAFNAEGNVVQEERAASETTANSGDGLLLTRSISDRLLSPLRRWFDRNRGFIQELMYAAAQSQEGTHHLGAQTAQFVDELVQVQRDYLDQFWRDLQAKTPAEIADILGPPIPGIVTPYTQGQVIARAESYGNAAWQGGQKVARLRKKASGGSRWERRIMGHPKTEHCSDCPPLAKVGWQPIGTLPDIGDTECGGNCLCYFEYSDSVEIPDVAKPGGPLRQPKHPKPKTHKIKEPTQLDELMADLREKLGKAGVTGLKINVAVEVGRKH
jgi:hypothetical protein